MAASEIKGGGRVNEGGMEERGGTRLMSSFNFKSPFSVVLVV